MSRILVVGDANVDLITRGDVVPRFGQAEQLVESAQVVLGGSAAIVASGLARLGVDTALVATVGDDDFGRFTLRALESAGVDLGSISTAGESTGLSIILAAPGDRSILTLPGAIPALEPAHVLASVEAQNPLHVHFASYFLLPGLAAGLEVVLESIRSRGITTSIDTNWDPAEKWTGLDRVLPLIDYFLPNLEELRSIARVLGAPVEATDEAAALAITELGPTVVVKAGADGGWAVAGQTVTSAPGLVVDVVDTTGAGDSFDAGYLAALVEGISDESARLRWAAVAGSLSTLGTGGTSRQPTKVELIDRLEG